MLVIALWMWGLEYDAVATVLITNNTLRNKLCSLAYHDDIGRARLNLTWCPCGAAPKSLENLGLTY